MHISARPLAFLAAGLLLGVTLTAIFAFSPQPRDTQSASTQPVSPYRWTVPELPASMSFAGERVPLDRPDVRERMERELTINEYGHSATIQILRLSSRYLPIIEARLKANGIPDDLKFVCAAESSFGNPTSKAGAVGYWQFMKDTGPRFVLEIGDEVDQRYDIASATDAACRYFRDAYNRFGSWTAAAASYNCGIGGYNGQADFQSSRNYYDILLPEETMRYVFRILALKHILQNPEKAGFYIRKEEYYQPYATRTYAVTESIPNLSAFAQAQGTTYKILKLYNPWLRDRKLTVRPGKRYELQLPK